MLILVNVGTIADNSQKKEGIPNFQMVTGEH